MSVPKLVLGTANIGSAYGISNNGVVITGLEAMNLLRAAHSYGITALDASTNYVNSEELLRAASSSKLEFSYHIKFPSLILANKEMAVAEIKRFQDSIKAENLASISFHDTEYLLNGNSLDVHRSLEAISKMELTERLGVSVYSEFEILRTSQEYKEINFFQVPENVLDRRLLNSSLISELYSSGKEFQVRSIFLQGLILMRKIPKSLSLVRPQIKSLESFAQQSNCNLLDLCLSYAKRIPWSSSIVVGAANEHQIKVISESFKCDFPTPPQDAKLPLEILDPRKWKNVR